jgi:hypothetical protein
LFQRLRQRNKPELTAIDILHKSSASNLQPHIIDGCDQAEAKAEKLSSVAISISLLQNAKHFEFTEDIAKAI